MYIMIFAEQANTEGTLQSRGSLYTTYKAQNQLLWIFGREYVIQLQTEIESHDIL